ncbi:MAG: amidohydrolase [Peptoniphilus sp.]|nr:amidohydrolase [Peptoniphilus sp.]MDD7362540.1 amidohydrolase [Bacillota bacterium]MDY6045061.1 amidohydrolase [Peptoniphilus sp.]
MHYIFRNTRYIDVIRGEVIEHRDIEIEDGKIKAIEGSNTLSGGEVIDGSNLLLVPGFVNAHTHLGMSYFRNYADDMDLNTWLTTAIWPLEAHLTGDDIYWASLLSMAEGIMSGTTTFCDMYYEMDRVADAALDIGMRGLLTRGLTDIDGQGEEKLEEVRMLYANCHGKGNGRLQVAPAPHAIYTCSGKYIKEIIGLAKEMDGIIHVHASETEKEVEDSLNEYKKTPVEYMCDLGLNDVHTIAAHCVHMREEEMDMVDSDKFFPVYNPSSNLKLASGFAPIKEFLDKGFKVALGTDGDSSNNNQNMLEEMHIASIVNKAVTMDPEAVSAKEVLRMATINGAEALGRADEIGSIEVGKRADIACFNLNTSSFTPLNNLISALCYSAQAEDVEHVLIDGEFVLRNRKFTRLNLDDVRENVERKFGELLERKALNDEMNLEN